MTHFSSPTPGPCSLAAVLLSALALLVGADCRLSAQTRDEYDRARQRMVSEFLEKQGITNPRVLQALHRRTSRYRLCHRAQAAGRQVPVS